MSHGAYAVQACFLALQVHSICTDKGQPESERCSCSKGCCTVIGQLLATIVYVTKGVRIVQ